MHAGYDLLLNCRRVVVGKRHAMFRDATRHCLGTIILKLITVGVNKELPRLTR